MKIIKNCRGFTLIELMIVVVIIALLAALAIPRFMAVSTKNKQAEAQLILKQIYLGQRAYHQEHSSYWGAGLTAFADGSPDAFADLHVEIMPTAKYTYTITVADNLGFIATATSNILDDDAPPDIWQIDEDGNLQPISDDAMLE